MNRIKLVAVIAVSIVVGYAIARLQSRFLDGGKFSHVQAYSYASGLTGLFDRDTGELYLYDANLNNCFIVRKVAKLGDPMQKVRDPDPAMVTPQPAAGNRSKESGEK